MKIKLTKYALAVLAITFTFALTSCSKNEDALATVQNSKQDILTFKTVDEFNETVQKVNSMKPEERIAWENSKGFKSFGTICDEFYKTIEPQNFKTIEDVNTFVASNSDKIQIYENKAGDKYCEVQEFDNSARYLMNEDRMFIVGDSVIKEFSEGRVSTNVANIDVLRKVKSFSDLKVKSTSVIFKAQPTTVTGDSQSSEVYDESDQYDGWFGALQTYRLVARFKAESVLDFSTYTDPISGATITYVSGSHNHYLMQVSNYVWHAVLFGVSHTTTYDISMDYINTENDTVSKHYYMPNTNFQEKTPLDQNVVDNVNESPDVHITGFHAKASNYKGCSFDESRTF